MSTVDIDVFNSLENFLLRKGLNILFDQESFLLDAHMTDFSAVTTLAPSCCRDLQLSALADDVDLLPSFLDPVLVHLLLLMSCDGGSNDVGSLGEVLI
jgi:hypothetical protein